MAVILTRLAALGTLSRMRERGSLARRPAVYQIAKRRLKCSGKLMEIARDGPVGFVPGGAAMSAATALLLLAAASATPSTALECPAIPGQTLVYVDIFDGPPENQADLVPDQHRAPGGKTAWNSWALDAGPDGLYVKCGYGKVLAGPYSRMETIKLPPAVKSCRADFKTGPGPSDLTLQRFSCR